MDCMRNGHGHWPRVGAEGAKVRRMLARAQTLQEGMDCRERDIEMVEGWSRRGKGRRKLAGAYM
jgi:hypothetical protein